MEIEKKYLIKELPDGLDQFPCEEIEQGYLCDNPTLRIRRKGNRFVFTYKGRVESEERLCVADEVERPLTREAYEHLRLKVDGILIEKTRYRIPFGDYEIELDVFHGIHNGLLLAEVEFPTVEEAKEFIPPEWFGEDVSGDVKYTNSYLSENSVK